MPDLHEMKQVIQDRKILKTKKKIPKKKKKKKFAEIRLKKGKESSS